VTDTSTPWLSAAEADAWLDLVAVAELLPSALDAQLTRDAGLTFFDYLVLAQLAESPERSLRMTDLASQTNATVARLSRVVGRLEADGLVRRVRDDSDGRGRHAQLTKAGVQALTRAAPEHLRTVRRLFADAFTEDEMQDLSRLCRRLLEALDPGRVVLAQTRQGRGGRAGLSSPPR